MFSVSSVPSGFQNQYHLTTYPNGRPLRGVGGCPFAFLLHKCQKNNNKNIMLIVKNVFISLVISNYLHTFASYPDEEYSRNVVNGITKVSIRHELTSFLLYIVNEQ